MFEPELDVNKLPLKEVFPKRGDFAGKEKLKSPP